MTTSPSSRRWVLGLAAVASFMVALDTLVVSTALTTIRADLGASLEQLEWTVNAYNLSFAVLLMTASALGDRFGRRRLFAGGLALFALASAACALAPTAGWLIAARTVQGAGAAFVMPLALALVSAVFPAERRGSAIGALQGLTGLAVATGPVIGGAVAQGISWSWIFWINVPIGLAVVPLALARIPESRGRDRSLDLPGLVLITLAAVGVVWGLVRGNQAGWDSAEVLGSLVGRGAARWARSCAWEARARAPMLPLGLFRSRAFSAGNGAIFLTFASLFGAVFFLAQFLQSGLGDDALGAGLRLLPWTATLFFVAPVAGALVDRFGERPFLAGGLLLQGVGLGWIALVADPAMDYIADGPGPRDRRLRRVDGAPVGAERRHGRRRAGGGREGVGREQHAARAGRRVRDRGRGGGLQRRGRLRVGAGVHRRLHRRDRGVGGAVAGRGGRGRAAAGEEMEESLDRGAHRPSGPQRRRREVLAQLDDRAEHGGGARVGQLGFGEAAGQHRDRRDAGLLRRLHVPRRVADHHRVVGAQPCSSAACTRSGSGFVRSTSADVVQPSTSSRASSRSR